MDLKLENKVVIVTGGSKGIGRGIVEAFANEKAKVVIVNRSGGEGEVLRDKINSSGGQALFIKADLTESAQCQMAIEKTLEAYGSIDVIVNNAGVNDGASITAGVEAFEKSLKSNLTHFYAMVHYGLDALKKSRGVIINIGSKVADTGQGGTNGYAASKGACNALTREWAVELAPYGIRCNTVIPAEVMTPLYERWLQTLENSQETLDKICKSIPFEQRMTTSEEIADMTVFLASPKSAHTTGQIVYVDGGYTHLDRKCTL
jgi:L-fucose dehydrogenase